MVERRYHTCCAQHLSFESYFWLIHSYFLSVGQEVCFPDLASTFMQQILFYKTHQGWAQGNHHIQIVSFTVRASLDQNLWPLCGMFVPLEFLSSLKAKRKIHTLSTPQTLLASEKSWGVRSGRALVLTHNAELDALAGSPKATSSSWNRPVSGHWTQPAKEREKMTELRFPEWLLPPRCWKVLYLYYLIK